MSLKFDRESLMYFIFFEANEMQELPGWVFTKLLVIICLSKS